MTPEQSVLWEIREQIATLDAEERERVLVIAQRLRDVLSQSHLSGIAFALVGAEEAAK